MKISLLLSAAALALASISAGAEPLTVKIGVLRQPHGSEAISRLAIPAADETLAGVQLGADDNNTTGRFTNQSFEAIDARVDAADDVTVAVNKLAEGGVRFVIADVPADRFLQAADAGKAQGMIFLNSGAVDERLREQDCRANAFHVAPSRAMLADALAQYLVWKQWRRWLLVKGSHDDDELLAQAYRDAARKFGAKIVEERVYTDTGGGRSSDTGLVQTQRQMPAATQNASAYDVLIAADENEVFAEYLPYRTWDARPVAGSAGLVPESWDPAFDQWGATQLQNRFERRFKRPLRARDAQAWLAMRMLGEAVTRTQGDNPRKVAEFMASDDFEIAAFKGQRLTIRPWNHQLRQPILLGDGRTIVSVSPQEGYLHQTSTLDTLGKDKAETQCRMK